MKNEKKRNRLISLDFFRGATIAGMILVNTPGSGEYTYAPLKHAAWHGITPTDFIFPFFIFIVGVSIVLAFTRQLDRGLRPGNMIPKIIRRTLLIFFWGLVFNFILDFDIANIRIPGVLQRIALVFLACAFLFLYTSIKNQWRAVLGILIGYWLILTLIPHPEYGEVFLEPGKNIGAWIDSILIPGSMYQGTWDPEGLLSTFPAIATGITGMLAGHLLVSDLSQDRKVIWLFAGGFLSFVSGELWGWIFPLNKNLWTSSYVLYTSGLAAVTLALCYFMIDVLGRRRGTFFGIVFGSNAITAYLLSGVFLIITHRSYFGGESIRSVFMYSGISWGINPYMVSLIWAILYCILCYIPVYILYRKRIFIKI